MIPNYLFFVLALRCLSCSSNASQNYINTTGDAILQLDTIVLPDKAELKSIIKSDDEWKSDLSEQEYYVLRKKGTERAFTGIYWDNKNFGTYTCSACELPLFESKTKFKSGTGWPSFYQPLNDYVVLEENEDVYGMELTEVLCARCRGHLGHVFKDGPEPTGLRYCINSVSLHFVEEQP